MPLRVFTWNVLHRVHGENHHEPAVARSPREADRIAGVVARVDALLKTHDVALLQEVSGDVLAALTAAFPHLAVHHHRYPRLPRRKRADDEVRDASEHLVVITSPGSTVRRAQTFSSDPGKGLLAVERDGVVVVSTHVSWGEKRTAQLAALAEFAEQVQGPLVIGGDFNVEVEVVLPALPLSPARLASDSMKTRVGEDGDGGADIDHLLFRSLEPEVAVVLSQDGLSDHSPVSVVAG